MREHHYEYHEEEEEDALRQIRRDHEEELKRATQKQGKGKGGGIGAAKKRTWIMAFIAVAAVALVAVGAFTTSSTRSPVSPISPSPPSSTSPPSSPSTRKELSIEGTIKKTIAGHKVVIYSKSYCGYSQRAKQVFIDLDYEDRLVVELDLVEKGGEFQRDLSEMTGIRMVPQVFIGGEFFGDSSGESRGAPSSLNTHLSPSRLPGRYASARDRPMSLNPTDFDAPFVFRDGERLPERRTGRDPGGPRYDVRDQIESTPRLVRIVPLSAPGPAPGPALVAKPVSCFSFGFLPAVLLPSTQVPVVFGLPRYSGHHVGHCFVSLRLGKHTWLLRFFSLALQLFLLI